MKKTDISQYAGSPTSAVKTAGPVKSVLHMILKGFLTAFAICFVTGCIVLASVAAFVYSMKDESVDYNLDNLQLDYTSFIYVNGNGDDSSSPQQYVSLYSTENRVWVDYTDIPDNMKDAIVAIEDKRFYEHNGVDWKRTLGAVTTLFSGGNSYGGSTITQQLIKNITGENEVSLTRKVKEIFRALNLEKKYSKEEILTAYLNVVNFGSGCNGVQAAANLYFGKNIQDCDLAECAAIAGITQNPTAYNPLLHPEANKTRQQTVLTAMYDQGMISQADYSAAMDESNNMTFMGTVKEDAGEDVSVWDWYTEQVFKDVKSDLMQAYNCSSDKAVDMIYHDGLSIYSAENTSLQRTAESVFNGKSTPLASYTNLQGGYVAIDYSGRVLAIMGGKGEKDSNRLFSLATDAERQPGSSIKPLSVYGKAMDAGLITYSSILNDEPLDNWQNGQPGPKNAEGQYFGNVTVEYALQLSLNAATAQLCKQLTPNVSFNFLKQKLGFTTLVAADNNLASMAVGGITNGVTVEEMTAGYEMFGNGGQYFKPYTYYYVTDHDGNVILDNRSEASSQVLTSPTCTIIHKLLNNVVQQGTGSGTSIPGWDIFGKTGTTNDNKDSWFIGGSPYMVAGMWVGYKTPAGLSTTQRTIAKAVWKAIMTQYLSDKPAKSFDLDPNVISAVYCKESGLLANPGVCTDTGVGWYDKNHLPDVCNLPHGTTASEETVSQSPSSASSQTTSSAAPSSSKSSSAASQTGKASGNASNQKNEP